MVVGEGCTNIYQSTIAGSKPNVYYMLTKLRPGPNLNVAGVRRCP